MQDRVDSKACLVTFCMRIPYLLLFAVTGAVLGSGLYLLIAAFHARTPVYMAETEYYIDFADGRLEAADYYNDFTWNDVLAIDPILGKTMEALGDGYDRAVIKEMITADILSDVRYLTITVKGENAELVGKVSALTRESLEGYGSQVDEFDRIYQVEDNGVVQVQAKLFTWRTAVLGGLIFSLLYIVAFLIHFHMEDAYYTRTDIRRCFDLPALGILVKNQKSSEEIDSHVAYLTQKNGKRKEDVFYLSLQDLENPAYEILRKSAGIVLQLPWGKDCGTKAASVIESLKLQDCDILGIILVDADARWLALYGLGKR